MCNHILQRYARLKTDLSDNARFLHNIYVLSFLIPRAGSNTALARYTGADSHKGTLMYFHYFTDLMNEWRKGLTLEAGTPNMAVAPAAAFPSIVVPLIRMPE